MIVIILIIIILCACTRRTSARTRTVAKSRMGGVLSTEQNRPNEMGAHKSHEKNRHAPIQAGRQTGKVAKWWLRRPRTRRTSHRQTDESTGPREHPVAPAPTRSQSQPKSILASSRNRCHLPDQLTDRCGGNYLTALITEKPYTGYVKRTSY